MDQIRRAKLKNGQQATWAGWSWWWVGLSRIGVFLLIIIGRILTPSESGQGTHRQLGLPPCPFLELTALPCPSCGLTTSFSHAAHLDLAESFLVQPFGLLIFIICCGWIPISFVLESSSAEWRTRILAATLRHAPSLLLTTYLLSWLYKIGRMTIFE